MPLLSAAVLRPARLARLNSWLELQLEQHKVEATSFREEEAAAFPKAVFLRTNPETRLSTIFEEVSVLPLPMTQPLEKYEELVAEAVALREAILLAKAASLADTALDVGGVRGLFLRRAANASETVGVARGYILRRAANTSEHWTGGRGRTLYSPAFVGAVLVV